MHRNKIIEIRFEYSIFFNVDEIFSGFTFLQGNQLSNYHLWSIVIDDMLDSRCIHSNVRFSVNLVPEPRAKDAVGLRLLWRVRSEVRKSKCVEVLHGDLRLPDPGRVGRWCHLLRARWIVRRAPEHIILYDVRCVVNIPTSFWILCTYMNIYSSTNIGFRAVEV